MPINYLNFNSTAYTRSFINVYNGMNRFVSKIFDDKRIKNYNIVKVSECIAFDSNEMIIEVNYTSTSGNHTATFMVTPGELAGEYGKDYLINVYKRNLKY